MWHNETSLIKSPRALTIGDVQYPASIFTKWAEVDLNAIGIYKVTEIKPTITDTQKYGNAVLDIVAHTYTHPVVGIPQEVLDRKEAELRASWKDRIDVAAGEARAFFAPYKLIDEEYSRTYQLTKDWLTDIVDDPALIAPSVVSSWATASGMTEAEAAANIIETGDQYNAFLDAVRAIRLNGKASVDIAPGIDIKTTGQGVIDTITALYIPPEAEEEVAPE